MILRTRKVVPPHRAYRFSGKYATLFLGFLALLAAVPTTQSTQPASQPTKNPDLTLDLGPGQKMEFMKISPGSFTMGSPETEPNRDDSEGPQHAVKIGYSFFMGRFEVTQAQYQTINGYNQSQFKDDPNCPEESVSWTDCVNFCTELSRRTGRKVRLPSEAEWEYADRAGTTTVFWVGNDLSSAQANFNGRSPYGKAGKGPHRDKTTPVGSFAPNAFGLYDTIGNVSEWCQDTFHDSYNGAPADGSAWEIKGDPEVRIYRGGAYDNDADSCRSAMRMATERRNNRNSRIGFRVVVEDK